MGILCNFKIKIESKNLEHGYIIANLLYPNHDQGAKPQQEPPVSSKFLNQNLKDM